MNKSGNTGCKCQKVEPPNYAGDNLLSAEFGQPFIPFKVEIDMPKDN